ncbi:CRISPR-associated endonuclease Cas2 [Deinococcus cellulosilyticus]|uniref:CRISPR-associated endoribonuclease Cas2 n=1 Tax=Deinococcus cellulosilyticus (strain DSM 18568 / NBRC 106333 / KACC 11606 / 5516J-15) TaxID=1223518 RepID=A0A511N1S6_DEIC1|nr:CRISPR-associated endonuclease Cas2 [Deinococcus cellulosilyticus]GEM46316.1 CRISPR-associated endoribonuclease Cas2 1 [Deinococcus cellulosilyticus NBRC 106333 = KACC 11606]
MDVLITYDVNTQTREGRRRLRKIATACQNYGQRVQLSVFECTINQMQLETLEAKLLGIMDVEQDSLRIYVLKTGREKALKVYGLDHYVDFQDPLIL